MDASPPIVVDDEFEWEVESIENSRVFGQWRKLQYLVKWLGYSDITWESAENVEETTSLDKFWHHHSDKSGAGSFGTQGVEGE